MNVICLDLEGVLVPEIWIAFSNETGIAELKRTTRDEPDYNKLMHYRMDILRGRGLRLSDIQDVISRIRPLDGAREFLDEIRSRYQVIILSDTFSEFASPLMRQLGWPTIFCNSLKIDSCGMLEDIRMRQENGKMKAVEALQGIGMKVFAAGDSYNDLAMIRKADSGCLFRAPENILRENPDLPHCTDYSAFISIIGEAFK